MANAKKCDFCRQFYMDTTSIKFDDDTLRIFTIQFTETGYMNDSIELDMCPECQKKLYNHSVMNQNVEY